MQRDTLALAYERVLGVEEFVALATPAAQAEATDAISAQILAGGPRWTLVAQEGDQLVGFAFAHAGVLDGQSSLEDGDPDPERTGMLAQILVEPRWGRRGHGSRLLAATVASFADAGYTRAVSWVPELNPATVNFLTSAGWERDGYARGLQSASGATVREIRLHTAI
jgi:GNAT superfamily N-acetyltransferase